VAGWHSSVHIQTKSEAQLGNKKVNINFFQHVPSVKGVFGFGCVTEVGMTIGANPKVSVLLSLLTVIPEELAPI